LKAWCAIRALPHYRHDAFAQGLRNAGYEVAVGEPNAQAQPGDVFVCWNRYGAIELACDRFEAQGGTVIIAENAYLGLDRDNRQIYALAQGYHNGRGQWPRGGPERFNALGLTPQPWQCWGEHVLVAPNRPFGARGNIMPHDWANDVARRLRAVTLRPVRVRMHPGNKAPQEPLANDLEGAWCVVIWSSSVGVSALMAGIPVICEADWWICKAAAGSDIAAVNSPYFNDASRRQALEDLAWAQWSVDEIASGEPFRRLMECRS
jgi:hypothetical protein